jgi:hypothetical protein
MREKKSGHGAAFLHGTNLKWDALANAPVITTTTFVAHPYFVRFRTFFP